MLLLVDAGNTRIKWAACPIVVATAATVTAGLGPGSWVTSGSVARDKLAQLEDDWRPIRITRVLLSNVAGQATRDGLEQILLRAAGGRPVQIEWLVSSASCAGVRNGYRQPQQLGSDRFASAIGGHALFPGRPLIIATCGTATTIDAVAADGLFSGGMILPGLSLMASSLVHGTAQLPLVPQQSSQSPRFADNTEEAIISGCLSAQVGAIEQAVAYYARKHPHDSVQCIVSGGAAAPVASQLAIPAVQVENLVLIGLQTITSMHY